MVNYFSLPLTARRALIPNVWDAIAFSLIIAGFVMVAHEARVTSQPLAVTGLCKTRRSVRSGERTAPLRTAALVGRPPAVMRAVLSVIRRYAWPDGHGSERA